MNICAIVCEYNPFHKGHLYHLEESRRQLGEETVMVGVMSGDYVQRGEAAVFSKFARAEAACRCGMNLMVELPLPWALSSAEGFAAGAVAILDSLGCTHLSFGSESGELVGLEALAECLLDTMTSIKVEDMLFKLKKECTMVVAVHTPQMAGRIAEETAMMEDGTVLEWSRTSDLFFHPQHLHTEQFVSAKFA